MNSNQRQNTSINSDHEANPQPNNLCDDIRIKRIRINCPFKVIYVNKEIIQSKTGEDVNIGDIITEINGINITSYSNKQAKELLASVELHSIHKYSTLEWEYNIRHNRRMNAPQNNVHTNPTSSMEINQQWDYDNKCTHCGCLFLKSEKKRDICCNNGVFLHHSSEFPKLKPLPSQLKHLLETRLAHFARNSVSYNNILALGATGVENGSANKGWEVRYGDHSVILHGRTYHFMTNTSGHNGLRYFLYDAQAEMMNHGNKLNQSNVDGLAYERIIPEYLQLIYNELQQLNLLVHEIEGIGRFSRSHENDNNRHNMLVELNSRTSHFDVAAITSDNMNGNRILTITRKGNNEKNTISTTDNKLEPLSYPLLFPYGEDGWGESIRKSIKFPKYLLSRMLMTERNTDGSPLLILNRVGKLITVNRFQIMCRLGQTYLVDNLSRAIDFRLAWHKKHQTDIFGISEIENSEDMELDEDVCVESNNAKTFLSQSFTGSRRHLRKLSTNALCIVSEYGRPSLFITLTCNAYWENITDQLLETQVNQ